MGFPQNSLISLKWPWDSPKTPKSSPDCCSFDVPWVLKPFGVLIGNVTFIIKRPNHPKALSPVPNTDLSKPTRLVRQKALTESEQGEAEHRALAAALSSGKEATMIEFYSKKCHLCHSLLDLVADVEAKNSAWLSIVMADAENYKWLPELLHYDIKYVPCFVLLDKYGKAVAKTGIPHSRLHVIAGLSRLLQMNQPFTKTAK